MFYTVSPSFFFLFSSLPCRHFLCSKGMHRCLPVFFLSFTQRMSYVLFTPHQCFTMRHSISTKGSSSWRKTVPQAARKTDKHGRPPPQSAWGWNQLFREEPKSVKERTAKNTKEGMRTSKRLLDGNQAKDRRRSTVNAGQNNRKGGQVSISNCAWLLDQWLSHRLSSAGRQVVSGKRPCMGSANEAWEGNSRTHALVDIRPSNDSLNYHH